MNPESGGIPIHCSSSCLALGSMSAGGTGDSSSTLVSAFSVVAMAALLILLELTHASPAKATADVGALARAWEPDLYGEVGSAGFEPGLRNPCVRVKGTLRCVPGAFLIGGWQTNAKAFGTLIGAHPDIVPVGNDQCFGTWPNDKGGRAWLQRGSPKGFEPKKHVMAALGCVTLMQHYPGFAGRFHKWWEKAYWPCKAKCIDDPSCSRTYYQAKMWSCKAEALATHDRAVFTGGRVADGAGVTSSPPLNVTPPHLMAHFYGRGGLRGGRVSMIALVRSPVDRLRHAFYSHVHYAKRYGAGWSGLQAYVTDQVGGWERCAAVHGRWRCAVHFEQLGKNESDVFFHCDQLIRGMYAPFVSAWLDAFPSTPDAPSPLLVLRTEDLMGTRAGRRAVLVRVWAHIGLTPLPLKAGAAAWANYSGGSVSDHGVGGGHVEEVARNLARVEGRHFRESYTDFTARKGPVSAETRQVLQRLYAPFNAELREMLARDGTSCRTAVDCDRFLWRDEVP